MPACRAKGHHHFATPRAIRSVQVGARAREGGEVHGAVHLHRKHLRRGLAECGACQDPGVPACVRSRAGLRGGQGTGRPHPDNPAETGRQGWGVAGDGWDILRVGCQGMDGSSSYRDTGRAVLQQRTGHPHLSFSYLASACNGRPDPGRVEEKQRAGRVWDGFLLHTLSCNTDNNPAKGRAYYALHRLGHAAHRVMVLTSTWRATFVIDSQIAYQLSLPPRSLLHLNQLRRPAHRWAQRAAVG